MILDITGTELIPGNCGINCSGNGLHPEYLCCCDECDYMLCCLEDHDSENCKMCDDTNCPNAAYNISDAIIGTINKNLSYERM